MQNITLQLNYTIELNSRKFSIKLRKLYIHIADVIFDQISQLFWVLSQLKL